jgi:hypothetical protein
LTSESALDKKAGSGSEGSEAWDSFHAFDRHYLYWLSLEGDTRMRVFGCDRQLSPRMYPISVSGREVYINAMAFYSDIG